MAPLRPRCTRAPLRIALGAAWLLFPPTSSALTPPSLRWEVLPGDSLLGVPIASDEQPHGPIAGNVSNTQHAGLTHNGITNVD